MFNDDGWGIFATLAAILCAFLWGKDHGTKKTVQHYEAQAVINKQQAQIDMLSKKLDELKREQNTAIITRVQ